MIAQRDREGKKRPAAKTADAVDQAEAARPVLVGACVDDALARIMSRRPGPKPTPRPTPQRIEAAAGTRRRPQRGTAAIGGRF
jgi:hypothetical protein